MNGRYYVHTLCFASRAALTRCFEELQESESLEDFLIEPAAFRLRFLAPPHVARKLFERIYLFGELTWCSSHPIESVAELRAAGADA
jgi:hypothetical protein